MAADRNLLQEINNWKTVAREQPWSFPTIAGPNFTSNLVSLLLKEWERAEQDFKIGILLAILCIKKVHLPSLETELIQIINKGTLDSDEWVKLTSNMVADFPKMGGKLHYDLQSSLPADAFEALKSLTQLISQQGIKFHPTEYAYIDQDVCDMASLPLYSEPGKTSTLSHFQLRNDQKISRPDRISLIKNAGDTSLASTALSGSGGISNNAPTQIRPSVSQNYLSTTPNRPPVNRPALPQTSSSLFIPNKRRLSQPSFLRPANSSRPAPINTSRGNANSSVSLGSGAVVESPTDITTGKTFQKPTRIQMLDMSVGTSIIKNQEETILKTQLEEQQIKESKRLEKEKRQEERRREEEEKRVQKEREKAEKNKQKEEARIAKEKEKRERFAARQAAAMAATTVSTNNSTPSTSGGARKKKRLSTADVSTQEELASDEEQLVHKTSSVVSIASPESPVSSAPTHLPLNALPIITSNIDSIPVNDEDEPTAIPPIKVASAQESTATSSDASTPNIASEQLRVLAENVLSLSNALSAEDRQTIMKFLEGTFERQYLAGNATATTPGVDDVIRDIIMHVERTPNYAEGKEIVESVIFEMNLTKGTWRKLKRKKIKRNAAHDGLNGRPNGNEVPEEQQQ